VDEPDGAWNVRTKHFVMPVSFKISNKLLILEHLDDGK
jgi:hypothetical protein